MARPSDNEAYNMESAKAQSAQNKAFMSGLKHAAPWAVLSSGAVWAGHTYWPAFRKNLGVSGKLSLAMMPPFVAYNLVGEASVLADLRAEAPGGREVAKEVAPDDLPLHLRVANTFCEHTFLSYFSIVAPVYGAILHNELSKPRYEGWRLSHALIHTRVLGQAAAVGSLVVVFGIKDVLRKNGAPFGTALPTAAEGLPAYQG